MTDTITRPLAQELASVCSGLPTMRVMEVCGTHTVAFHRTGVRSLMPDNLRLISGPGCPVCVSPQGYIDAARTLAAHPEVTVCTYGDMLRVPGRGGSLQDQRAVGADIRVVYSARDAVQLAADCPDRTVVFVAVGFETTIPGHAAAAIEAERQNLDNFCMLVSHKLVVPAMEALLADPDHQIDGFLCPGHVSVIIGPTAYAPVAERFGKPCVVAGFEPEQMLIGLIHLVRQLRAGEARVENIYGVAVQEAGNPVARRFIEQVFEPADTAWRAMGTIPESGLVLRPAYARFDALRRFSLVEGEDYEMPGCRCGQMLQGKLSPSDCPLFGNSCTPLNPVGPCMVSSEGSCAAAYRYAATNV